MLGMVLSVCGSQQSALTTRLCNFWMTLARGALWRDYPSIHVCILLYVCGLLNDAISSADLIVLNGTVIHE